MMPSGTCKSSSIILPFAAVLPNITCICFAKIPIPIAANIPCIAEEGKKSPKEPILKKPRIINKTPEITMAAKVYRKPCCISPFPSVVIAAKITTTKPLPGPVIVTLEPPINETTVPPTMAAIIPEIGGAPDAKAKPKPRGSAIKETTKPANKFRGISVINVLNILFLFIYLTIKRSVGNSDKIYSISCGKILSKIPDLLGAFITNKSALLSFA